VPAFVTVTLTVDAIGSVSASELSAGRESAIEAGRVNVAVFATLVALPDAASVACAV
jgi:hypothetical protein